MFEQGDLFPEVPDPGESSEDKAERVNKEWAQMTLQERLQAFMEFHQLHPEVYGGIVTLSREMKKRGMKRWGMQAAFEVLRFQWVLQYQRSDFKVNNNFRSYYSRFIMEREPDLKNFYEIRAQG